MRKLEISKSGGGFYVLYGATGVGKTRSILQSLPEPVQCIYTEPRDPHKTLQGMEGLESIDFLVPETFDDLTNHLNQIVAKLKAGEDVGFKSLSLDSASYWMAAKLSRDLEDETYEAEVFKRKRKMVDMTRKDEAAFGAVSSLMKRTFDQLGVISQHGITVVVVCLLTENPKWDATYEAAPSFIGRDFPTNMPGYVDAIGLVESRYNAEGEKVYPPLVSFEDSFERKFVCKWSGRRDKKPVGPLDMKKILAL